MTPDQIRQKIEKAKTEIERSKGRVEQLRTELKNEFNIDTAKQAKAEMDRLAAAIQTKSNELETRQQEFEEKWADELAELA